MKKERPAIFISYRQADSGDFAGRLGDRLKHRFGRRRVFLDIGGIDYGANYATTLRQTVARCHVVITVIGKAWVRLLRERAGEEDWVLIENTAALERGVNVIPVRIGGAAMPTEDELPEPIKALRHYNGPVFDLDDFDADADKLIAELERILAERGVRVPWPEKWRRTAMFGGAGAVIVIAATSWAVLASGVKVPAYIAVIGNTERLQHDQARAHLVLDNGRDAPHEAAWDNEVLLYLVVHEQDKSNARRTDWQQEIARSRSQLIETLTHLRGNDEAARAHSATVVDEAILSVPSHSQTNTSSFAIRYVPEAFSFENCKAEYKSDGVQDALATIAWTKP